VDEKIDEPRKVQSNRQLPWTQGFLGGGIHGPTPGRFGIRAIPAFILVGPDCRIVARGLRGGAIKKAVAEAMAKSQAASPRRTDRARRRHRDRPVHRRVAAPSRRGRSRAWRTEEADHFQAGPHYDQQFVNPCSGPANPTSRMGERRDDRDPDGEPRQAIKCSDEH
jgi:hypothetical protein